MSLRSDIASILAKKLIGAFISSVPGAGVIGDIGDAVVEELKGSLGSSSFERKARSLSTGIAKRLCDFALSGHDERDSGAAFGAVADFEAALRSAPPLFSLLLECDLNAERLRRRLGTLYPDPMASARRRRFYDYLAESFAAGLVLLAPEHPQFAALLGAELLKRQRDLQTAFEQHLSPAGRTTQPNSE